MNLLRTFAATALIGATFATSAIAQQQSSADDKQLQEQAAVLNSPKGVMLYQLGIMATAAQTASSCKGAGPTVEKFEKSLEKKGIPEFKAQGGTAKEFKLMYNEAKSKAKKERSMPSEQACKELLENMKSMTKAMN